MKKANCKHGIGLNCLTGRVWRTTESRNKFAGQFDNPLYFHQGMMP